MSYFTGALSLLVGFLFEVAVGLFVFRLLLQWAGASFQNPISQFFYMATNPVLMPMRRFLPTVRGFNTAAALVAWLLAALKMWLVIALTGHLLNLLAAAVFGLAGVLTTAIWLWGGVLLLTVLISLINPGADHAIARIAWQLTEPVLRPIRRRIPALGPFDLSALVAWFGLVLVGVLVVAPLNDLATWLARGWA